MASRIGVRELKNRASEIVRDVHEHDAEYIVTLRGEPVALLRAFPGNNEEDRLRTQREDALVRLDALAEQVARSWRSSKTAVELLEEDRS
jgi:antitoxin (DNA-binding transcriptional repressor) of toxin-antitoxin stability system